MVRTRWRRASPRIPQAADTQGASVAVLRAPRWSSRCTQAPASSGRTSPSRSPAVALVELHYVGLAVAFVAAVMLLVQKPRWRRVLAVLAPVGRMPLTTYFLQSLICTFLLYGWGLGWIGWISPVGCIGLAFAIFGVADRGRAPVAAPLPVRPARVDLAQLRVSTPAVDPDLKARVPPGVEHTQALSTLAAALEWSPPRCLRTLSTLATRAPSRWVTQVVAASCLR